MTVRNLYPDEVSKIVKERNHLKSKLKKIEGKCKSVAAEVRLDWPDVLAKEILAIIQEEA